MAAAFGDAAGTELGCVCANGAISDDIGDVDDGGAKGKGAGTEGASAEGASAEGAGAEGAGTEGAGKGGAGAGGAGTCSKDVAIAMAIIGRVVVVVDEYFVRR